MLSHGYTRILCFLGFVSFEISISWNIVYLIFPSYEKKFVVISDGLITAGKI